MKLLPETLLGRTAIYLGAILVVSSLFWTAVIGYFLLRPLREIYGQQIADTLLISQSLIEHDNAETHRLFQNLLGLRIVPDTDPLPQFVESRKRPLSDDILKKMRKRLGNEVELKQEQGCDNIWIRFPAGKHFYWLIVPVKPPPVFPFPILIWVGGGFAVSIGGAYLIIYQIGRHLRRVTEATQTVGHGLATPSLEEAGPQEIRDLSAGFNQMANDLQRIESERRIMLAGISHDLRTPLTRLRIATEFVANGTDPKLAAEMVHDIEELDSILKQFLDYARDGSEETLVDADLDGIVLDVCQRYIRAGHSISVELGAVPRFAFRPLALRRVVTNLIENAVRYGRKSIEVRTQLDETLACIEVRDRGTGVASDRLKEIDRPFVRGSSARSELGAGLGLAIVDRIVKTHGGRVVLQNRPEGGFLARTEWPVQ